MGCNRNAQDPSNHKSGHLDNDSIWTPIWVGLLPLVGYKVSSPPSTELSCTRVMLRTLLDFYSTGCLPTIVAPGLSPKPAFLAVDRCYQWQGLCTGWNPWGQTRDCDCRWLQDRLGCGARFPHPHLPTSDPGFHNTEGGDPVGAGDAHGPGSYQKHQWEIADQQYSDIMEYKLFLYSPPHSLLFTYNHLCRWANHPYDFNYHLYVDDSLVYQNFPCPDFSMIYVDLL